MNTNPATPDQRRLATELGVSIPSGATVDDARWIISNAPATDEQHSSAANIGLKLAPGTTFQAARTLLKQAYQTAGKRTIASLCIRVGDVLLHDKVMWRVQNIFDGYKLSVKEVLPERRGRQVVMVPTARRGKVFNAYTLRDAEKIDPQTIRF